MVMFGAIQANVLFLQDDRFSAGDTSKLAITETDRIEPTMPSDQKTGILYQSTISILMPTKTRMTPSQ